MREPLSGTTTMPCTSSDDSPSACRLQVSPASSLRKAPSISTPTHTERGATGSGMMVVMRVNSDHRALGARAELRVVPGVAGVRWERYTPAGRVPAKHRVRLARQHHQRPTQPCRPWRCRDAANCRRGRRSGTTPAWVAGVDAARGCRDAAASARTSPSNVQAVVRRALERRPAVVADVQPLSYRAYQYPSSPFAIVRSLGIPAPPLSRSRSTR